MATRGFESERLALFGLEYVAQIQSESVDLPSAERVAWIFVLKPPRLRPMACAPFSPHCVDGHARWWKRSGRIRYPHPAQGLK